MAGPTVEFGGATYTLRPLTLAQLRVLLPAFLRVNTSTEEGIDAMIDVLSEALRTVDPAITRDVVLASRTTMPEVRAAVETIAILSGLEMRSAPGEASAAESTG